MEELKLFSHEEKMSQNNYPMFIYEKEPIEEGLPFQNTYRGVLKAKMVGIFSPL